MSTHILNSSRKSFPARIENRVFEMPLDKGVERAVNLLLDAGVETFESCEGGEGHAYTEPTVRFHGERAEGFKAFAIALQYGLKVSSLRRVWPINDGEPTGPWWELVSNARGFYNSCVSLSVNEVSALCSIYK